eukprot:g1381.t1
MPMDFLNEAKEENGDSENKADDQVAGVAAMLENLFDESSGDEGLSANTLPQTVVRKHGCEDDNATKTEATIDIKEIVRNDTNVMLLTPPEKIRVERGRTKGATATESCEKRRKDAVTKKTDKENVENRNATRVGLHGYLRAKNLIARLKLKCRNKGTHTKKARSRDDQSGREEKQASSLAAATTPPISSPDGFEDVRQYVHLIRSGVRGQIEGGTACGIMTKNAIHGSSEAIATMFTTVSRIRKSTGYVLPQPAMHFLGDGVVRCRTRSQKRNLLVKMEPVLVEMEKYAKNSKQTLQCQLGVTWRRRTSVPCEPQGFASTGEESVFEYCCTKSGRVLSIDEYEALFFDHVHASKKARLTKHALSKETSWSGRRRDVSRKWRALKGLLLAHESAWRNVSIELGVLQQRKRFIRRLSRCVAIGPQEGGVSL